MLGEPCLPNNDLFDYHSCLSEYSSCTKYHGGSQTSFLCSNTHDQKPSILIYTEFTEKDHICVNSTKLIRHFPCLKAMPSILLAQVYLLASLPFQMLPLLSLEIITLEKYLKAASIFS